MVAFTATPLPAEAIGYGPARRIRFLTTSVPSVGYRLYDIRDVAPSSVLPDTVRFADGGRALNDLGEGTGSVVLESNGPVSATLPT